MFFVVRDVFQQVAAVVLAARALEAAKIYAANVDEPLVILFDAEAQFFRDLVLARVVLPVCATNDEALAVGLRWVLSVAAYAQEVIGDA